MTFDRQLQGSKRIQPRHHGIAFKAECEGQSQRIGHGSCQSQAESGVAGIGILALPAPAALAEVGDIVGVHVGCAVADAQGVRAIDGLDRDSHQLLSAPVFVGVVQQVGEDAFKHADINCQASCLCSDQPWADFPGRRSIQDIAESASGFDQIRLAMLGELGAQRADKHFDDLVRGFACFSASVDPATLRQA